MNKGIEAIAAIIAAIIGVAIVAVLVGQNSQTSNVINSAGTALSNVIKAATAPVVGGNTTFSGSQTSG